MLEELEAQIGDLTKIVMPMRDEGVKISQKYERLAASFDTPNKLAEIPHRKASQSSIDLLRKDLDSLKKITINQDKCIC